MTPAEKKIILYETFYQNIKFTVAEAYSEDYYKKNNKSILFKFRKTINALFTLPFKSIWAPSIIRKSYVWNVSKLFMNVWNIFIEWKDYIHITKRNKPNITNEKKSLFYI